MSHQNSISVAALRGAMAVVREIAEQGLSLSTFELTADDWRLVTGNRAWLLGDRARVMSALDGLCGGVMDSLGIGRMKLSAEYIAFVIAAFCRGVNCETACRWMERHRSTEDIASGGDVFEEISDKQLMALVLLARGMDNCQQTRELFDKMFGVTAYLSQPEQGDADVIKPGRRTNKA